MTAPTHRKIGDVEVHVQWRNGRAQTFVNGRPVTGPLKHVMVAESLRWHRLEYRRGNKVALWSALIYCDSSRAEAPRWIVRALAEGFRRWHAHKETSLEVALGAKRAHKSPYWADLPPFETYRVCEEERQHGKMMARGHGLQGVGLRRAARRLVPDAPPDKEPWQQVRERYRVERLAVEAMKRRMESGFAFAVFHFVRDAQRAGVARGQAMRQAAEHFESDVPTMRRRYAAQQRQLQKLGALPSDAPTDDKRCEESQAEQSHPL